MSSAVGKSRTVRPQESATYATLMPNGSASIASLRRSRAIPSRSALVWASAEELTTSRGEPTALHISSRDFATSTLYAWSAPSSPS